jgi:sialidase-1
MKRKRIGLMLLLSSFIVMIEAARGDERWEVTPEQLRRSLEILRAGIGGDEFWPAMHAAEALTLAGHANFVIAGLSDRLPAERDDQRRCGLARELVRAGDRGALPILLGILGDPDSTGRVHAAESLFKLGLQGDGHELRAALEQTTLPQLQLWAAAASANARRGEDPQASALSSEGMALIRKRLLSDDRPARVTAAFALSQVGNASDIAPLQEALSRESDEVTRAYFTSALAKLGDAAGRRESIANLRSENASVKALAAETAGHARLFDGQSELIRLLDDPVTDVRIRAAQSLLVLSLATGKR